MSSALQTLNEHTNAADWAERITECRNSDFSVREWCYKHKICRQTYYRWQNRLFKMAKAQQAVLFAEATPVQAIRIGNAAVTVHTAGPEFELRSSMFNMLLELTLTHICIIP